MTEIIKREPRRIKLYTELQDKLQNINEYLKHQTDPRNAQKIEEITVNNKLKKSMHSF